VADVTTVSAGSDDVGEIVHVPDHQTLRDPEMQGSYIEEQEEWGNCRALGGTNIDGG